MYICTVIALLATFLWLNITIAETNSVRLNPYKDKDFDKQMQLGGKVKTVLAIIMALFWAVVITF